jgi:hypothetical protein
LAAWAVTSLQLQRVCYIVNRDVLVHDVGDGARPVRVTLDTKATTAIDTLGAMLFARHHAAREGHVADCAVTNTHAAKLAITASCSTAPLQQERLGAESRKRTISMADTADGEPMAALAGDVVHQKVPARALLRVKHALRRRRIACRDHRDAVVAVGDHLQPMRGTAV